MTLKRNTNRFNRFHAGMALILTVAVLSGCGGSSDITVAEGAFSGQETIRTSTIFAMDTVMDLRAYGGEDAQMVLSRAEEEIRSLEKKLSVTDESSEIAKLNAAGSFGLSEEPYEIMKEALYYCESTEGALDITIYPVLKSWGFTTGEYQVPSDAEISELLENVDFRKVTLSDDEEVLEYSDSQKVEMADENAHLCTIPEGMQVDLGSVTKGYTSRTLAGMFREYGITSGLINLGGNVECIGTKPDGSQWNVAVKSPYKDSASGILGVIQASDEAIITSGGYERYFEEDGETYWHIIDPENGKPAKNGLISVTIVGQDGLMCDALSTALFVKGLDGAIEYYKATNSSFDMVLVTEEGEVYITKGLSSRFTLSNEYHDMTIKVIE